MSKSKRKTPSYAIKLSDLAVDLRASREMRRKRQRRKNTGGKARLVQKHD